MGRTGSVYTIMDWFPQIRSNIDLREELKALLYGRVDVVPQGRPMLLRRFTDTPCSCYDQLDGSPVTNCAYCEGEGFIFADTIETMILFPGVAPIYKAGYLGTGRFPFDAIGFEDPSKATAYCEYSVFLNYERYNLPANKRPDKMYELKVDESGTIVYPLVRTAKWKILSVTPMHGDFGRVEYFVLGLDKEYLG